MHLPSLYRMRFYVSVIHAHALIFTSEAVNFDLRDSSGDALEDGLRGAVGSPATERVLWLGTFFRRGTCIRSRDKVGCVFCSVYGWKKDWVRSVLREKETEREPCVKERGTCSVTTLMINDIQMYYEQSLQEMLRKARQQQHNRKAKQHNTTRPKQSFFCSLRWDSNPWPSAFQAMLLLTELPRQPSKWVCYAVDRRMYV